MASMAPIYFVWAERGGRGCHSVISLFCWINFMYRFEFSLLLLVGAHANAIFSNIAILFWPQFIICLKIKMESAKPQKRLNMVNRHINKWMRIGENVQRKRKYLPSMQTKKEQKKILFRLVYHVSPRCMFIVLRYDANNHQTNKLLANCQHNYCTDFCFVFGWFVGQPTWFVLYKRTHEKTDKLPGECTINDL